MNFNLIRYKISLILMCLTLFPFFTFANSLVIEKLMPASPATLHFGQEITISFRYAISERGGARIFIRPVTGEQLTPNYSASGSQIFMGEGNATATFKITSGETTIDYLRVQVYNRTRSRLLFEFSFPVAYNYASGLAHLQLSGRALNRELLQPHREIQQLRENEPEPFQQQEGKPVTKKILPDGSIEITYPDGRVETRYKGGFSVYDPKTGQTQTYLFSTQARAAIPPSLPGEAETVWLEQHSEGLLYIIKSLVAYDSTSIQNYLQFEEGQDIYNQIITREETINYMVGP